MSAMRRITHVVLLTGLCVLSLQASRHRVVFFSTPKSWKEAQLHCREQCTDLTTFSDMEGMNNTLSFVEGKYDDAIWFGLWKTVAKSWHWSLTSKDFYQRGENTYFLWNTTPTYHCGTFKQGFMDALPCHYTLPSVCFDATKEGPAQYILTNDKMGWTYAQDFCRTFHTDLTSVRNAVEAGIIQDLIGDLGVWIGLFRDTWVWSDQANSSLRFWPADQQVWNEGADICGALLKTKSGRWGGRNCSEVHPFLCSCKYPDTKQRFIKVRLGLKDSALDPNDAEVQKNFLKQLRLQQKEDVLLIQWRKQPNGNIFVKQTP